jgi:CheY-like chemotaxis protein
MGERNSAILLIHDDPELLDTLTRLLEERGIEVSIAASAFAATSIISERSEGEEFDVIVTGWDSRGRTGAKVHSWVVENRFQLRDRFVFLAHQAPEGLEELVEANSVFVAPEPVEEVVRVIESAVSRVRKSVRVRADIHDLEWVESDAPLLLLVEDEPLQLSFMIRLFRDLGFSVTPVESGNAAIALLGEREFDVLLADWYMPNGSGNDLYDWLIAHRPEMAERCFFMSGGMGTNAIASAPPGCQILPKGQDSETLVETLLQAARKRRNSR